MQVSYFTNSNLGIEGLSVENSLPVSHIEKIIIYNYVVWFSSKTRILQKLTQLQRGPLISITKCYKTVSTDNLYALSECIPLKLKIEMEINDYFQNLVQDRNKFNLKETIHYVSYRYIESYTVRRLYSYTVRRRHDPLEIYTDESKNNDQMACTCVIYHNYTEVGYSNYKLNNNVLVFMAECAAIYKAVHYIIINGGSRNCTILTDSMSVLESIVSVK